MNIAVFDIGTNSIHMLIVEIRPDLSYEVLGHEKDTTRLGDGSFESHRLRKGAMQRAWGVVDRFYKIAKAAEAKKMIAVATSAVRDAKNGREFIREIYRRTGIRVQIISGHEEGRLIELAARSSVETRGQKTLVVDIGGGSMELILGDGKKHYYLESFPLGVARLTDLYLRKDPPSNSEIKELEEHIEKVLKKPARKLRKLKYSMVIGTAGTLINLGSMVYEDETSKPLDLVNHYDLDLDKLKKVHEKIIQMPLKERLNFPGLDSKRADIIVAGSVLVVALMKMLKVDDITLSGRGIREGMITDYIEKNKKKLHTEEASTDMREKCIWQLLKRWSSDTHHAEQVTKLALSVFDQTHKLHKLEKRERDILKFAALLHNIGYSVNYKRHHKHTFYLIMNSDLDGFKPEEIEMIAPTVAKVAAQGIDCKGPYPADTLYIKAFAGEFDGVVSMFHDQGQIATKLHGFGRGVTITAGLETVFTTPSHGTAFDIVGRGVATTGAFETAVRLAAEVARRRGAERG